MVAYSIGAIRHVRRFVVRKRIGKEVKYFQTCCWEEVSQVKSSFDGFDVFSHAKMIPTKFIPEKEFWGTLQYRYGVGQAHV